MTILGDDLYCKQPLCEAFIREGFNFIRVCKPSSHKTLYEGVSGLAATGDVQTLKVERREGKRRSTDFYRFANPVPVRDGEGALRVNGCELTTTRDDGQVIYKKAFATHHLITEANVAEVVRDGRARGKVENENNTTLKTKGSHLTHHVGHGKKYLSSLLATFTLLAFLFHTRLDQRDSRYRRIRPFLPRKRFFNDLRALTGSLCCESWDALMAFMIEKLERDVPDTS